MTIWRELPAPPAPTPKIVPHSLEHWHDPKVERPEEGREIIVHEGDGDWYRIKYTGKTNWYFVSKWTYAPETAR